MLRRNFLKLVGGVTLIPTIGYGIEAQGHLYGTVKYDDLPPSKFGNVPVGTCAEIEVPFIPSRISWMRRHFGMKWTEFRKILADIFVDTKRDAGILERIRARIWKFVPVRSGRLLDTIYKTLSFKRKNMRYNFNLMKLLF